MTSVAEPLFLRPTLGHASPPAPHVIGHADLTPRNLPCGPPPYRLPVRHPPTHGAARERPLRSRGLHDWSASESSGTRDREWACSSHMAHCHHRSRADCLWCRRCHQRPPVAAFSMLALPPGVERCANTLSPSPWLGGHRLLILASCADLRWLVGRSPLRAGAWVISFSLPARMCILSLFSSTVTLSSLVHHVQKYLPSIPSRL